MGENDQEYLHDPGNISLAWRLQRQAADRGKREAPDHKSVCQMVYADKHGSVQEFEKFIIENQKMPFQLRKIVILPSWIAFPEVLLYPCQDYFFLTPDG